MKKLWKAEIKKLDREKWKGAHLPMRYRSSYYYDVIVSHNPFEVRLKRKKYPVLFTHNCEDQKYPDRLYEEWWENAEAYGIAENGTVFAAIELCPEEWSNRLIVTELCMIEELRGKGLGAELMDLAKAKCMEGGYRALILETQSSNGNAVDFYLHEGFSVIGMDLCCYSNRDLEKGEVRLNLGWFPDRNG